jgi:hypothetical protein
VEEEVLVVLKVLPEVEAIQVLEDRLVEVVIPEELTILVVVQELVGLLGEVAMKEQHYHQEVEANLVGALKVLQP